MKYAIEAEIPLLMRKIFSLLLLAGSTTIALMLFLQRTPEEIIPLNKQADLANAVNNFSPEKIPDMPAVTANEAVQNIGSAIAQEIIAQNPDGPEIVEDEPLITAPDPRKIAEKIIKERFSQSSFALLTPEIDLNSLKIVPDNDAAFVNTYLENTKTISASSFAGIDVNFNNPDVEKFKKIAEAYQKTIDGYYSLNVPSGMAEFHKEKMRLFMQQQKIFANIANIQKDPLSALISMRLLGQAYGDLTDINAKIFQFAKKNNL